MNCTTLLGTVVNCDQLNELAIGMYLPRCEDAAGNKIPCEDFPVDCGGLQEVVVVVGHEVDADGNATQVLHGCNGTTTTQYLPNTYLVDESWKKFITGGLVVAVALLLIANFKSFAL